MIRTLVVVGDSLLDLDTTGRASRLSPDGPVPVVQTTTEEVRAGGAALTAALAAGAVQDGAVPGRVVLVTPLADDADGATLRAALPASVQLVGVPWAGTTSVKHRIRAGGQTVTRVDRGGAPGAVGPLPPAVATALADADAVVVADYGLGATADPALRELLTAVARRRPVVWDPHPRGAAPVPGCRLVTPNAVEALGHDPGARPDVVEVSDRAVALRREWRAGAVVVTLGAAGAVATVGEDGVLAVPAPAVLAGDTCGAGDRFSSAAGWALACGALPTQAVAAAVAAASEYVAASATAPATGATGGTAAGAGVLVASGGCFDLLHAGHVATLEAARALGDRLVVCVNSDDSVRRLKGPGRPLQPAADRVRILRALSCVDDVVVFDEDTPEQVLRSLRPRVWVKGGDYAGVEVPESAVLAEWGGRVVTVPFLAGRSTTRLAEGAVLGPGA